MPRAASFAVPDQAIEQQQHRDRRCSEPKNIEIHVRKDHQVDKDKQVGDTQTRKTQPAPEQQPHAHPAPGSQQQDCAGEAGENTEDVNRAGHCYSRSFLSRNAFANSRTELGALEWMRRVTRISSLRYVRSSTLMMASLPGSGL